MTITPRALAPFLGVIAGIESSIHGVGEMRQGAVRPSGFLFDSWIDGPIAKQMQGEPALTLIPHLFATGLVVVVLAAVLVTWSLTPLPPRRRGIGQVLVAVALLLVGGGIAPPVIGALGGVSALLLSHPGDTKRNARLRIFVRALGRVWRPLFWATALVAGGLLVTSLAILVGAPIDAPAFLVGLFLAKFVLVSLTIPAGIGHWLMTTTSTPPPMIGKR
jgi:hypothetical protein